MTIHPEYAAAHRAVYTARGKASAHTCACGQPARDWALTVFGPTYWAGGMRYSTCVDDYTAMCRACHERYDRPAVCVRGHSLGPDGDVYIRKDNGGRMCRACARERDVYVPYGSYTGARTHCPKGHPYDAANTYRQAGRRVCKTCTMDRQRARRARQRGM